VAQKRQIRVDLTEDTNFPPRSSDQRSGVLFSLSGSWDEDREILEAGAKAVAEKLNGAGRTQEADNVLNALKRREPDLGRPQPVRPEDGDNEDTRG
jgi:hypothetical protein